MQAFARYVLVSVCLGLAGEYKETLLTEREEVVQHVTEEYRKYSPMCSASLQEDILSDSDLEGREIPVALANFPPFLEVTSNGSRSPVEAKGMGWVLMNTLASHFNFTPVPLVAPHDVIGRKDSAGQWTGALQLLVSKEAEFTVLPVTYTEERHDAIDFSFLLGTTTYGILARRPDYTPKPYALLRPFNITVWLWILGSTAVMGPLIYFIVVFRVRLCRGDPKLTRTIPFGQCVWFVYGAMMKQGSVLKPISDSSRILFATWWLFIMIVTSFYTANLTAFLTFNGLELSINGVEDLAHRTSLSWLAYNEGALVDIIQNHSKMKTLRKLQIEGRGRFVDSREEALELVRKGTHVYVDDMRVLNYLIQEDFKLQQKLEMENTCYFYTAPLASNTEYTFWYGYGFKKDSLYRKVFDKFFQRLSLFGIMDFLHNNATSNSPVCSLPKGFKEQRLKLRDLYTTYIITGVGFAAATISLLFEVCGRRRRKKINKKFRGGSDVPSLSKNITVMNIGHSIKQSIPTVEWLSTVYPAALSMKTGNQPFSQRLGNMMHDAQRGSDVIRGQINDVDVIYDKRNKKLIMRDVNKLRNNITFIDGIPYTFLQYVDDSGPRIQKLIISDLL